jgi:hypothetical protein
MPAIVNFPDFLKVGIMAFLFIVLFTAFLKKAGMPQFTISGV